MPRHIRITAICKQDPDIRLYVLTLIALARQLQEEEDRERAEGGQAGTAEDGEATHG